MATTVSSLGWKVVPLCGAATGIAVLGCQRATIFSDVKAFFLGAAPAVVKVRAADFCALTANDIEGRRFSFEDLKGKVALITNVSSKWGVTKRNYEEMVMLHQKLKSKPFEILAFPCNQFGNQEPGNSQQIRSFADGFGVEFRMMEKIEVNGPGAHPVYTLLKGSGSDIRWNFFSKFLVRCGPEECEIRRYDGAPHPLSLEKDIVNLLDGWPSSD